MSCGKDMTDELVIKLQKLWKRIDEEPKWMTNEMVIQKLIRNGL